ncbi:hypothetical protein BDV96DRAFT_593414 [Lophiotrema nucula]|uniref:Uncharacterized protein n=1 Tax=Lophiotrema nucula TaxID=690887 RepID=A0A6A5ZXB0_9PLEO|nr:hypothetical protein BDV96DRAFT_593414 [Lophiotrema nucula]
MNWTGGRLQRHSRNANKGVLQKQKAFFAKARTQLQNGKSNLTAPFRPSYFQDDDAVLGNQLPGFGLGTTRRTGHPRRLQARSASEETSGLDVRHSARASLAGSERMTFARNRRTTLNHEVDQEASSRGPKPSQPPTPHRSELKKDAAYSLLGAETAGLERRGKKQANDMEAEDRLLEANRRRLLKRQDWAGLAPSRPLELRFESRRDKHKIGKRRKIEGRPVLLPDRVMAIRRPHLPTDRNPGPYVRGATEIDEDISIRIGTDALTSLTPMQQGDHAPLHEEGTPPAESSDLMLFDDEDGDDVVIQPSMEATRAASQELDVSIAPDAAQASVYGPHRHTGQRDKATPEHNPYQKDNLSLSDCRRHDKHRAAFGASQEEFGSSFQITRRIGGVGDPLRLVFDERSDMLRDVSDNARLSNFGRTTSESGDECGSIRMGKTQNHPAPKIDDAPWRVLAAVPEHSSSRSGRGRYETSHSPQRHIAKDQNSFDPIVGSQHATLGDNTRISVSSRASTSLPSIKRAEEHNARLGNHCATRGDQVSQYNLRDIDESEKLWRQFVFVDGGPVSETTHSDRQVEDKDDTRANKAFGGRKLRFLPSSLAVASPISSHRISTPLDTAPWVTSDVSDSMRNAAGSAASLSPRSGSVLRKVTPPRYLEEYDQLVNLHALHGACSMPTTEDRRVFSEQTVTHASLQNNVSHDTDGTLEEFSGDSKTSRDGLDRRHEASKHAVGPRLAKRREHRRDPSWDIYNIPTSDQVSLVDPYRSK